MSLRYAVLREVVMRCSVFVALVSSRGIELVVVSLGQLGGAAGWFWSPVLVRVCCNLNRC